MFKEKDIWAGWAELILTGEFISYAMYVFFFNKLIPLQAVCTKYSTILMSVQGPLTLNGLDESLGIQ